MRRAVPVLIGWLFLAALATAQPSPEMNTTPAPAPTDAAAAASTRLTVRGQGLVPADLEDRRRASEMGRRAALLNAYRKLVEAVLEHEEFGQDAIPGPGTQRVFKISQEHPNDRLLSFALRAQPSQPVEKNGVVEVTLTSPPLGEMASTTPTLAGSVTYDADADGIPDTVAAGYDGRIYVLKGEKVLGRTPSQTLYSSVTYRSPQAAQVDWEQVRLARLDSVESVESAGPGKLRVLANFSIDEQVCGQYAGGASEQREVLINLRPPADAPKIELEEPFDFAGTSSESLPLLGFVGAPSGLANARLLFNGRPYWATPDGLKTSRLKMDVLVPLLPGMNRAQIVVVDNSRQLEVREVTIRRNAPVAALDPSRRKALVIGVGRFPGQSRSEVPDAEDDAAAFRDALLGQGGFPPAQVHTLLGKEATREAILASLRQLREEQPAQEGGRGLVVIYYAGLSQSGATGKCLACADRARSDDGLSAADLAGSFGHLGNQEVLLVLDTARNAGAGSREGRWLENNDFLSRLEKEGWAAVASSDPSPNDRLGERGGHLTRSLIRGLQGEADANADGLVEFDELARFAVLATRKSVKREELAPQVALLRGEVLGRIPLSRKATR